MSRRLLRALLILWFALAITLLATLAFSVLAAAVLRVAARFGATWLTFLVRLLIVRHLRRSSRCPPLSKQRVEMPAVPAKHTEHHILKCVPREFVHTLPLLPPRAVDLGGSLRTILI